MSAQAIGGLAGAFVIGAKAKGSSPLRLLGWGAVGLGFTDLVIFNYPAFLPGIWLALILFVIAGLPVTAFGTGFTTAIQAETDDLYRGRVFGALSTTMALLMIVGAAIAGAATERLGAVAVLTIDSIAYVAAGLFALRTLASGVATRIGRQEPAGP